MSASHARVSFRFRLHWIISVFLHPIFQLQNMLPQLCITIGMTQSQWIKNQFSAFQKVHIWTPFQTKPEPGSTQFAIPWPRQDTNYAAFRSCLTFKRYDHVTMSLCLQKPPRSMQTGLTNTRTYIPPNLQN